MPNQARNRSRGRNQNVTMDNTIDTSSLDYNTGALRMVNR